MHDRGPIDYFLVFDDHLEWLHPQLEILVRDVPFLLHWLTTAELLFGAGATINPIMKCWPNETKVPTADRVTWPVAATVKMRGSLWGGSPGPNRVKTDPCIIPASMQLLDVMCDLSSQVWITDSGDGHGLMGANVQRSFSSMYVTIDKQGWFVCRCCHRGGVDLPWQGVVRVTLG